MMKGQKGYVLVGRTPSRDSWGERMLRAVTGRILRWYELHRQRQQLARLNDSALKDLGLSRADIHHESERPFWDDPMRR